MSTKTVLAKVERIIGLYKLLTQPDCIDDSEELEDIFHSQYGKRASVGGEEWEKFMDKIVKDYEDLGELARWGYQHEIESEENYE